MLGVDEGVVGFLISVCVVSSGVGDGVLSWRTLAWTWSMLLRTWVVVEEWLEWGEDPRSWLTCSARVMSEPSQTPACSTRWVSRWREPSRRAWSWADWLVSLSVAFSARVEEKLMESLRSLDWVERCWSLLEASSSLSSRSGPISEIRWAASAMGPWSRSRRASS